MPDPRIPDGHYVDLADGRFSGTTAADLDTVFHSLEADANGKHLVVHFHGGLVSRASAHRSGSVIYQTYRDAGAFPVFFVWNSDLYQSLRHSLDEIARERAFRRLVLKVGQLVLGKFAEAALPENARSASPRLDPPSLKEMLKDDLEALQRDLDAREAALRPQAADVTELTTVQADQVQRDLAQDRVIQEESQRIANGLRDPAAVEAERGTRGTSPVRGSTATLMSPSVLAEIAIETPDAGARGIGTLITLARYGTRVVRAVLARYRDGRHHSLYGTVVQEVLRALYMDNVGVLVWNTMKNDTRDAFGADLSRHGGTAFLHALARHWPQDRQVTLVGHSTGAVYIGEFLEAADRVLPADKRFNVIFLAAACSFPDLHKRLDLFQRRVAHIRSFGLTDEVERGYWEFPPIMHGSLLYFVAGLLEEAEADMPLVGMQRYYGGAGPYVRPDIAAVAAYLDEGKRVWAGHPNDLGPGRRSTAGRHGEFDDEDVATRESLAHILRNGF